MNRFVTISEAARQLGCSTEWLRTVEHQGKIPDGKERCERLAQVFIGGLRGAWGSPLSGRGGGEYAIGSDMKNS